jgi:hypothetical protein
MKRRRLEGVDLVAVILAVGLALTIVLVLVATMVQILNNAPNVPEIQLSENATQILVAAIGGVVGVLGGYVGYRLHERSTEKLDGPYTEAASEAPQVGVRLPERTEVPGPDEDAG